MSSEPKETEMIQLTANHTTPQVLARKQITAAVPAEQIGNPRAIKILWLFIGSHACTLKGRSVRNLCRQKEHWHLISAVYQRKKKKKW